MVKSTRDSAGKLLKVSRKLFGVTGDGLKLKANHRYRVVGEYDNPTGQTEKRGAMAHMSGIFAPDDMSKWPAIDPSQPRLPAGPGVTAGARNRDREATVRWVARTTRRPHERASAAAQSSIAPATSSPAPASSGMIRRAPTQR